MESQSKQAQDRTVTLLSGEEVPSDSEAWRHECEARAVCKMPGRDTRIAYLARVEKMRGLAARTALETMARKVWSAEFAPNRTQA